MTTFRTICAVLFTFFILIDFCSFAYIRLYHREAVGKLISRGFFLSAVLTVGYLGSMLTTNYMKASLFSSLYFATIPLLLCVILQYAELLANVHQDKKTRIIHAVFFTWTIADVICLLTNPFHEISISYQFSTDPVALWHYKPHLLYYLHLLLCYLILVIILYILGHKMKTIPKMYLGHLINFFVGLATIVLLNAGWLLLQKSTKMPDISLLLYSFLAAYTYWNHYFYAKQSMLNSCREILFSEIGQPLVVFDYSNHLVLHNIQAEQLFSKEALLPTTELNSFLAKFRLDKLKDNMTNEYSFQWSPPADNGLLTYRCNYHPMCDENETLVGKCIIFSEISSSMDLLTGFHSYAEFNNHFSRQSQWPVPTTVAVMDINRLSVINHRFGKARGDNAIQLLASTMRSVFPSNAYFARMNDATLVAVCENTTDTQLRSKIRSASSAFEENSSIGVPLSAEGATYMIEDAAVSVNQAVQHALSSLRSKKLIDRNSAHSSLLDSLIQIQQESDITTEAHVKRTYILGKQLGERLGFTDLQISQLHLLCLLHDIGKVGIPLEILNKTGPLTLDEWTIMRSHAERGFRIASASNELESISNMILHHHEAWDGSGYPDGLKKEAIPFLSRVIAVIDAYDAMTHWRPYRQPMSPEDAQMELRRQAGKQFDPTLTTEFLLMLNDSCNAKASANNVVTPLVIQNKSPMSESTDKESTVTAKAPIAYVDHCHYYLDSQGNVCDADSNFEIMTGYTRQDIQKRRVNQFDLIFAEDLNAYRQCIDNKIEIGQDIYIEHRIKRKDGGVKYVLCLAIQRIRNADIPDAIIEIFATDVTETTAAKNALEAQRLSAKRAMELVRNNARLDSLTELLHREAFQNETQQMLLDQDKRFVIMMIDLDNFKQYNDTHGHYYGDTLLRSLGSALREFYEKNACYAGRMGGDEFAMSIVFDVSRSDEEIKQQLNQMYNTLVHAVQQVSQEVTISAGTVICNRPTSFNDVYKQADSVLYSVKANGKARLQIQ